MGVPEPLNTRPNMSRDTGVFSTCLQGRRTARTAAQRRSRGQQPGVGAPRLAALKF